MSHPTRTMGSNTLLIGSGLEAWKSPVSAWMDWFKDIAPSTALRQWFDHKPERWEEFQRRYFAELDEKADVWRPLLHAARSPEGMTLLFAARDTEHNNAVALKRYLEARHNKAGEES